MNIGDVSIMSNLNTQNRGTILTCSAEISPNPLPENVPYPNFKWLFGQTNSSLPSSVTVSNVTERGNNYSSTLQFSPLLPHHAGIYTCRLGRNERLSATIEVEGNTAIACFDCFNNFVKEAYA